MTIALSIAELLLGLFINIRIGRLAIALFRKDGTSSRLPLRVAGVFLIINWVSRIFHI
ncbi:MAG: putative rane protein [Paenibacillaceae bacterium]|jgi:hypothetical protein|nr:putative rane protein [Paenibacillaceae bacterium]